ncbi:helix-turn-helix domain-containing protein [Lacticaseibacillus nasuensis]|uniref:HTH cro/C1-type domain-containing protein n=1 Tax=Lacticaseibacillus nasuensis JCM 17158 TaxID=1291734 RepID=A0A0R1JMW3_9LACO|nr:helix-turn-helix domain-containing protein [Lacticaseibacillus nasuensis]KRK70435.1 hypothetical protein FD02_GL000500 [Lacticaseibacillus nasuensis JCM 17158]
MPTIGEFVGALRADKNVSVAQLTSETDMSEATYNRILTGAAEPKLPTFFALLTALRTHIDDLATPFSDAPMPFYQAWMKTRDLLAQFAAGHVDVTALKAWQRLLAAESTRRQNVGLAQLQQRVDLAVAEAAHDRTACTTIARQLFDQLREYSEWSEFEFTLAGPLVAYLPFADVQLILARLTPLTTAEDGPQLNMLEGPLDDILVTALRNALLSHVRANVDAALTAVATRVVRAENVYFQAIQKTATSVIIPALAGDLTTAKGAYADLIGALHFLIDAEQNAVYTALGRLWAALQDYLQAN